LRISGERGVPQSSRHGEIGRDGYRIEKIALAPEPGITLPGLVFVPVAGPVRKPAVLYVNSAGKAADAGRGGPLETMALAGHVVLALDPRGWGEGAAPAGRSGYSGAYQTAMRAILIGKTLAGMQVSDVLRGFDYLASRPDVDAAQIRIHGKGNGGVAALYAAALEPRIRQAVVENAPLSYMDFVRAMIHENTVDLIVPGVLRQFDLPDVARAIAPRALEIVNPRAPAGGPAELDMAKSVFGAGVRVVAR
jgi:cephalosporin-C deacetylase-like acetyl esterase